MKTIRKAVRTFLIQDDKVLATKYNQKNLIGYYDVPGGKIEEDESPEETAIREFEEEAGIIILDPKYSGNLIVEYPDRIYDFSIFVATKYKIGNREKIDSTPEWIEIKKLLKKDKLFAEVYLLEKEHWCDLINRTNFKLHFIADMNRNKIDEVNYKNKEGFWQEYYK